ncbi:MAG: carbamate kinase [Firmicutes bacterium]|nr:carbamate kinase [Bacillota bacterium]
MRIVAALGGNALEDKELPPTAESQLLVAKKTAEHLADMSCRGYEIAVVHGNGPQIGRILLASEYAKDVTAPMPFDVCGAMSQGYIGYHLQQALSQALYKRKRFVPVVTVITQVAVDPKDPAFEKPSKPIGPFYSLEEAERLQKEKGWGLVEDSGRGWRRVVPSPKPHTIIEIGTIKTLWHTTITIACGGGGIPVIIRPDNTLEGVAAVIDKDLAAEKLAEDMDADVLLILTEVEKVYLNFNQPDQKALDNLTTDLARKYIEEGHFPPGSMLPKMEAAVKFASSRPGRKSIITSLYAACDALAGKTGTVICSEEALDVQI